MTRDEAIARECIRQTINGYNAHGDAREPAPFLALFAGDAVFEFSGYGPLPGFHFEGQGAIRAITASWGQPPVDDPMIRRSSFIRHNLTTCHIELTGPDTARAKTYFIVFTDIGPDHFGSYHDELACSGGSWLFAHREIRLDWRSPDSIYPPVRIEAAQ